MANTDDANRRSTQGRRGLPINRRRVLSLLSFLIAIASIVSLSLILPAAPGRSLVDVGRGLVIVVGSILPAMIYAFFIQDRLGILETEYRQNLRRLGFPWKDQLYTDKFRAIYGSTPMRRPQPEPGADPNAFEPDAAPVRTNVRLLDSPVLVATLVTFFGWLLVFYPRNLSPTPDNLIPNPSPLAYGFLGAYLFGLGSLIRQYVTDDLQQRYYASLVVRYITVLVLSWLVEMILLGGAATAMTQAPLVVAFVIGIFPSLGLRLAQRVATRALGFAFHGFREDQPLHRIDGLNAYREDRLLLEGIENIHDLACANVVDLMLKTRFPVEQLVDWSDQALLQLHARDHFRRFYRSGIRTATDFLDAYDAPRPGGNWPDRLADLIGRQPGGESGSRSRRATAVGDAGEAPEDSPITRDMLDTLALALRSDPNLFHISNWRGHPVEALPEDIERARTRADLKLMEGLPAEAIDVYDRLLRDYPREYALLLYRGMANFLQHRYHAAIEDYRRAIDESAGSKWNGIHFAHLQKGRALREIKQYAEAAQAFRDALVVYQSVPDAQLEPVFQEARVELADVMMTHLSQIDPAQYDEAIRLWTTISESRYYKAEALANRGVARHQRWKDRGRTSAEKNDLILARDDLVLALSMKPALSAFYTNLAMVYGDLGQMEEKKQTLNRVLWHLDLQPSPNHAYIARLERGYLYLQEENYPAAADDFLEATRMVCDRAQAYTLHGIALAVQGEWYRAEHAFVEAIGLPRAGNESDQARAYFELGGLYRRSERLDEAQSALEQAVAFANDVYDRRSEEIARLEPQRRVTPDQIEERDLVEDLAVNATVELGGLHLERDDAEATVRLLTPIVVVYDDVIGKRHVCAEAYFLLGRARAAQNDLAAARENYEKARDRLAPASDEDADLRQQVDDALDQLPPDTP